MTNRLTDTQTFEINQPKDKAQQFKELLERPEIYAKVQAMAADVHKVLSETAQVLQSIKPGAKFRDKKSKSFFTYDALVQAFKPDMITQLVLETAKLPWTEFQQPSYIIIREDVLGNDGKTLMQRKLMLSTKDFVKIIAVGRWEIVDYGPQNADEAEVWPDDWRSYLDTPSS